MDLAEHQRLLLHLIKRRATWGDVSDPYLREVAQSQHLESLRKTILWWREFDVERSCPFTSALMMRRGVFRESVEEFSARANVSPFIELLGQAFLEDTFGHPDPVIVSMAKFEMAIGKVKRGDAAEYEVDWPCDPRPVLNGEEFEMTTDGPRYRTQISARIVGYVRLSRFDE